MRIDNLKLANNVRQITACLKNNGRMTRKEIVAATGIDWDDAYDVIQSLIDKGELYMSGGKVALKTEKDFEPHPCEFESLFYPPHLGVNQCLWGMTA